MNSIPAPATSFWRALQDWAQTEGMMWSFIFKVMLSAFLALWLAYRLELPQPSTVLATVCVVIQRQNGEVLAKSFWRLVGTLLGLSVMVLLIALFNQERVLFLLCLAAWVGLCTAGAARYRDFRSYACVLAGYTAVIIGLPSTENPDGAFMQALWRVMEISLGILCTAVVSGLLLPQTSSAVLRRTLSTRMRDFADFAYLGLSNALDQEHILKSNVEFASQAVALETLRNASVFEDPHMRLRRGRLGRLNNEFMVVSTRLHALMQLRQRLLEGQEQAVLNALQICLDPILALLEPLRHHLFQEQDGSHLAWQLEQRREPLMQNIRKARSQLTQQAVSPQALIDFNTAAELLFRFTDGLHSYAQTHASLSKRHHSRERWDETFTPHANGMAAAVLGLRGAFMILAMSVFWIASAWPSGNVAVQTIGLICGLSSVARNPKMLAQSLLIGASSSALVGFCLMFWVYPLIDGFTLLICTLVPVFAFGGWMLSRPDLSGYGAGFLLWFCLFSLPGNETHYLPYDYLNDYFAALLGMFFATLSMALILPPNRPWLWRRLEQDLRQRVVFAISSKIKGLVSQFESGTHDLLNQAYMLTHNRPDVQKRMMRWSFCVQEIGHAVIDLRLEQERLPEMSCYAEYSTWRQDMRSTSRALIRLFLQPDENNRQRALAAVEQTLASVHMTVEPFAPHFDSSPLRRIASHLHSIRSSLLDPNSPLAEPRAHA